MSRLTEIFQESTHVSVLRNCALVLTALASGDHNRAGDAQDIIKKMAQGIQNRLLELLLRNAKEQHGSVAPPEDGDDNDEESDESVALQNSITLCLRRLCILSKRMYLGELLVDVHEDGSADAAMDTLYKTVAEYIAKELDSRKVEAEGEGDDQGLLVPDIWTNLKDRRHVLVSEAVQEAMSFLLAVTGWRLNEVVESIDRGEEPEGDPEDHIVWRMRDSLLKLIALCFEQFLDYRLRGSFSAAHWDFSTAVQKHACKILGDLRILFPKAWVHAVSPFLAACSLGDGDPRFSIGYWRFLSVHDSEVRAYVAHTADHLIYLLSRLSLFSVVHRRQKREGSSRGVRSSSSACPWDHFQLHAVQSTRSWCSTASCRWIRKGIDSDGWRNVSNLQKGGPGAPSRVPNGRPCFRL